MRVVHRTPITVSPKEAKEFPDIAIKKLNDAVQQLSREVVELQELVDRMERRVYG